MIHSFCLNKIEDQSLINILGLQEEIETRIYNIRKENNLHVFETLKENIQKLKDKTVELLVRTIREYETPQELHPAMQVQIRAKILLFLVWQ